MSLTRGLILRPDHEERPICVFQRQISDITNKSNQQKYEIVMLLETFGEKYGREEQPERYAALTDFAVSIAEPISRPQFIHEYQITEQSLRAAGQLGLSAPMIKQRLLEYSKYEKLPDLLEKWLSSLSGQSVSKAISIQLYDNKYYLVRMPRDVDVLIRNSYRKKRARDIQSEQGGMAVEMQRQESSDSEDDVFYTPEEPLDDVFFSRLTGGGGTYRRTLVYVERISDLRRRARDLRLELVEEAFIPAEEPGGDDGIYLAPGRRLNGSLPLGNSTQIASHQKLSSNTLSNQQRQNTANNGTGAAHTAEYLAIQDATTVRAWLDGELLEIQEQQRYWRQKPQDLGKILSDKSDDELDAAVRLELGDCGPAIQNAFRLTRLYRRKAPRLQADLRSTTQLRTYQAQAVQKVVTQHEYRQHGQRVKVKKLSSGMVVMPCGSGKSLQGIATACRVGHSCIVVTNSNLSSLQWASQFKQFTTIQERRIFIFGSGDQLGLAGQRTRRLFIPGFHTVLVATYQMLTSVNSKSPYTRMINQLIRCITWGTVLFDEAHQMFAKTFKSLFIFEKQSQGGKSSKRKNDKYEEDKFKQLEPPPDAFIRSYCKVGLTATPLREDDNINRDLHFLGRRLFECSWGDLAAQGYLASLSCIQVDCTMSRAAYARYWAAEKREESTYTYIDQKWLQSLMHQGTVNYGSYGAPRQNGEEENNTARILERSHSESDLRRRLQQLCNGGGSVVLPLTMMDFPADRLRQLGASFGDIYKRVWALLPVLNVEKLRIASLLVNFHVAQGHQVLLFCDSVVGAEIYARVLDIPFVKGDVQETEREAVVEAFLERRCSCILLTRVGDTSLDLPDANVLIEVDWQSNSKRQETQRIGRISRPKSSGYEGFFYILVSQATHEAKSAHARRQYLTQQQGYSYCQVPAQEIEEICKQQGVKVHQAVKEITRDESMRESYLNEIALTLRLYKE